MLRINLHPVSNPKAVQGLAIKFLIIERERSCTWKEKTKQYHKEQLAVPRSSNRWTRSLCKHQTSELFHQQSRLQLLTTKQGKRCVTCMSGRTTATMQAMNKRWTLGNLQKFLQLAHLLWRGLCARRGWRRNSCALPLLKLAPSPCPCTPFRECYGRSTRLCPSGKSPQASMMRVSVTEA